MKRGRIAYLPEELAWIEARKEWPRARLHSAFCFIFDRTDVTQDNIRQLCNRNGWRAGPEGRRRNAGKSRVFSQDEMDWLRANASLPIKDTGAAFRAAFPGRDITDAQVTAFRKNHKLRTGRTGRFEKGQPSHNKGKKGFYAHGCEKGWFKKGGEPHNTKHLGYERVNKDGYVEISVDEPNPHTGYGRRFVHKHRWLWEKANGPVPQGYALKCLDGDRTNCDPSNWEAVKRGVLSRLNGGRHKKRMAYDTAPDELKPTVMAIAKVQQAVHELRKRGQA